jgi:hypothetical protein
MAHGTLLGRIGNFAKGIHFPASDVSEQIIKFCADLLITKQLKFPYDQENF